MNDSNPFASPVETEEPRPATEETTKIERPKLISFVGILSCIYVGWLLLVDFRFLLSPDASADYWILLQLYVLSVWLAAGTGPLGIRLLVSALISTAVLLLWQEDLPEWHAAEMAGLVLSGIAVMTALLDKIISLFSPRPYKSKSFSFLERPLLVPGWGAILYLMNLLYFSRSAAGSNQPWELAIYFMLATGAIGSVSAIWLLLRKHALSSWTIPTTFAAMLLTVICFYTYSLLTNGFVDFGSQVVRLCGPQLVLIVILWFIDYFLRIWGLSLVPIPAQHHTVAETTEEDDLDD